MLLRLCIHDQTQQNFCGEVLVVLENLEELCKSKKQNFLYTLLNSEHKTRDQHGRDSTLQFAPSHDQLPGGLVRFLICVSLKSQAEVQVIAARPPTVHLPTLRSWPSGIWREGERRGDPRAPGAAGATTTLNASQCSCNSVTSRTAPFRSGPRRFSIYSLQVLILVTVIVIYYQSTL